MAENPAPIRAIVELRKLQDLLVKVQLYISETAIAKIELHAVRTNIDSSPEHIMRAAQTFRSAEATLEKAVQSAIQAHIDLVQANA